MMSHKNRLMILVTFFCFFLSAQWAFSIGISQEKAASIARNFLNNQKSFHTIASVKTFTYEGQKAGYLMELNPILTAFPQPMSRLLGGSF